MEFKLVARDLYDWWKGIKKGTKGYITGICCEQDGYKLYEVQLEGYGAYLLWDWQIEIK